MSTLIIVDMQYDFLLRRGALAVPDGMNVIPVIEELASHCDFIVATRDWHPANHCSFVENGGSWPKHCVAGTFGANIHPLMDRISDAVISKGMKSDHEEYSGFENPALERVLFGCGLNSPLYVTGLATDYCVLETVRGAIRLGYRNVIVPRDAVRGVNILPDDSDNALTEMALLGATIL